MSAWRSSRLVAITFIVSVLVALMVPARGHAQPGWSEHVIDHRGDGADALAIADVNGDGWLDLAGGYSQSGEVVLCLNPLQDAAADPDRWPCKTIQSGSEFHVIEDLAVVDDDLDGRMDGLVAAVEGEVNQLFLLTPRAGEPTWQRTTVHRDEAGYNHVTAGDLDNDGHSELVASSKGGGLFSFQRDASKEGRWIRQRLGSVHNPKSIQVVDVDGDGLLDVLVSDLHETSWFRNPGPAILASSDLAVWVKTILVPGLWPVALCDVDGDGLRDAVVGLPSPKGDQAGVWFPLNTAPPFEQDIRPVLLRKGGPTSEGGKIELKGIACGRVQGRGDDIIFSAIGSGVGLYAALNQRQGRRWIFRAISPVRNVFKYDPPQLVDIDRDGDLDILTVEEDVGRDSEGLGILWYENKD